MTNDTSTSTFATSASRGDSIVYRAPVLSDGAPAVPYYRADGAIVMLLDTRTACPWILVEDDRAAAPLAPVPYLGALSVILSDLVTNDVASTSIASTERTIAHDGPDGRELLTYDEASAICDQLASDLTSDGAEVELEDGRTLRLRVECDESDVVENLGDGYGRIVWCDAAPTNYMDRPQRPADMDGNAEKLGIGRSYDQCWWQPSPDGPKRGTAEFAAERAHLVDLLDRGFRGYIVELCDAEPDAYGALVVRESASLWGIDADDVDAETVAELVWEAFGF